MAEHLASIFGTEKDRVNCPFYFKIGACRHGDRCSRLHNRPTISPTILMSNMYQRPDMPVPGGEPDKSMDPRKIQDHFEDFYEDLFEELSKYGEIESLNVCDNLADHMVGNVYVNFKEEEQAGAALNALTGRFYAGRPIMVDFSPVTDFRESTCRQYEENTCNRGGYCNFMHLRKINKELRRKLFGDKPQYAARRRSRSRSPPPFGWRGGGRGGGFGGRGFGGRGRGRGRFNDDRRYDDRGRDDDRRGGYDRHEGRGRRRSRSRSRSPVRDASAERRAKIEQWNREREERDNPPPPGGEAHHPGAEVAPPGVAPGGYGYDDRGGYGDGPPPYGAPPGDYGRGPPGPPPEERRGGGYERGQY